MTPGNIPDGIDNDCDGLIDEEICDNNSGRVQSSLSGEVAGCQSQSPPKSAVVPLFQNYVYFVLNSRCNWVVLLHLIKDVEPEM